MRYGLQTKVMENVHYAISVVCLNTVRYLSYLIFDIDYPVRCIYSFVTALHGMQTRSSDENSVCPSVGLSVTLVAERSVQILYHTKDHLA